MISILKMSKFSDRILITMDHTNKNRQDLADYLFEHGAQGVLVCKEFHGGTEESMKQRIQDPDDPLTEETSHHMCAAGYGKFHKDNMTTRGRKYFQKKYNNPKIHWSTLYAHCNVSKAGKVSYTKWPYEEMIKYLTVPTEKKDIDSQPLILYQNTKCTLEELLEEYEKYSDIFTLVRKRKHEKVSTSDIIEELYHKIPSSSTQCSEINLFIKYYYSINVENIPNLLPRGITLYPWQQKVLAWANQPLIPGEPNGLWMSLHAGSGKTCLLSAIYDSVGSHNIYQLSARPGGFDLISLLGYDNQPIILLDELSFHVDDQGIARPKTSVVELLKRVCSRFPISIQFGSSRTTVVPQAKVLITSNHPRLSQPDAHGVCPFARRYIALDSKDFLPEMLNKS